MIPRIPGTRPFFIPAMLLFMSIALLMMVMPGIKQAAASSIVAQETVTPQVLIDTPLPGDALQGVVAIHGNTDVPGFRSAEVAFAYQPNATGTWFVLQQNNQPVKDGTLANWDTTTITDGIYQLRVQVFLEDGQKLERVISGVRVRNYTTVETSTPVRPTPGQPTLTFTPAPRKDFQVIASNPTALPTNPALVTPEGLGLSALQGVMLVFSALVVAGVYLGVRALGRRS